HNGAVPCEEASRRHPAAREPDHERGLPGELRRGPRHAPLPREPEGSPSVRVRVVEVSCSMRVDVHLSFNVARLSIEKMRTRIQNRITTFDSSQPDSSKWWWSGAMRKIRTPRVLKEPTWRMTDIASRTNSPPTTTSSISCLLRTASVPRALPSAIEPTSPMKTSAGWQLNQRKPMLAPTIAAEKTASSPEPRT